VPTDPAERITSFLAETVVGAPPTYKQYQQNIYAPQYCDLTSGGGTGSWGTPELHLFERRDAIFNTTLNELHHGGVDQDGKIGTGLRRGKVARRGATPNTSASRRLKPTDSKETVVAATHILVKGVLWRCLGSVYDACVKWCARSRETDRSQSVESMKRWDELARGVVSIDWRSKLLVLVYRVNIWIQMKIIFIHLLDIFLHVTPRPPSVAGN